MKTHSQVIGKRSYDAAVKKFGSGWNMLSPKMKEMAVSAQIVDLLFAQHEVAKESMEHVLSAAREAFELLGQSR